MRTNKNTVGAHPWVTCAVGFVLLVGSVALLSGGSVAGEVLRENALVLELRTFFEGGAGWHEGAWPTQDGLERERVGEGAVLGLSAHEAPVALAFSLVFFWILALSLETAWGSVLFGGFLVLVPLLSSFSYAVFYGASDNSWLCANGVVAALLGAYAVRSVRGLAIPAWLLLPIWGVGQSLLSLPNGQGGFDPPSLMLQGIGFGFGALAAGAIWALRLEEKLAGPREEAPNRVSNPVHAQARRLRSRGKCEAAFELLAAELRCSSGDYDVAIALWQTATGSERVARAVPALLGAVRDQLRDGRREEAIALWLVLTTEVEDPKAEANLAVRIGEALLAAEQHEAAMRAFEAALAGSKTLSSLLALRVARSARELDADLAGRAGSIALLDDQLGTSERVEMQAVVRAAGASGSTREFVAVVSPEGSEESPGSRLLAGDEVSRRPVSEDAGGNGGRQAAESSSGSPEERSPRRADQGAGMEALARPNPLEVSETTETTETLVPADLLSPATTGRLEPMRSASVLRSLRVRSARPLALDEEGIALEIEGGHKIRLAYDRIEAVAAGAVGGLSQKPVLIVDLVLNWMAPGTEPLKVIRLRSDDFDPRSLVRGSESPLAALRLLLEQLISRSRATPLPAHAAALGSPFTSHADIECYGRVVLESE